MTGQQLSGDLRGPFLVAWFELPIEHQLAQLVFHVTDPAARWAVETPHQLVAIERALPLIELTFDFQSFDVRSQTGNPARGRLLAKGFGRGDIGGSQIEQIGQLVAGVEHQPADGAIGPVRLVGSGAAMQLDDMADRIDRGPVGVDTFQYLSAPGSLPRARAR